MSTHLSDRGHRIVLAAASELAEVGDPRRLVPAVLAQIRKVIGCEVVGYNVFDLRAGTVSTVLSPNTQAFREPVENHLARLMWQHPLVVHFVRTDDREPRRLKDVVDIPALAANPAYREVLVPMGVPRQLAFPTALVGQRGVGAGFAINRGGGDFTEEDRGRAAMLQPLLTTLMRRGSLMLRVAPPPSPAGRDPAALTRREGTVLALLAAGLKADSIGRTLGTSPRTVRKHLQNIYGKLEVSDRLTAVERARAAGLLPVTRPAPP